MSGNKKISAMVSTNRKREDTSSKTYTVERLLKQRKRKGRTEYLVKWKHYDRSHNSWEPEGNILDRSLIENYKKQKKSTFRRSLSSRNSIRNQSNNSSPMKNDLNHNCEKQSEKETDDNRQDKTINSTSIDYWYPPLCEQKTKIAITDITSNNVTITFRELI